MGTIIAKHSGVKMIEWNERETKQLRIRGPEILVYVGYLNTIDNFANIKSTNNTINNIDKG